MAYIHYNPNPRQINTGDCVVRAFCKALGMGWEKAYVELCVKGLELCRLPNDNTTWEKYLKEHGFVQQVLPSTCPDCYTIADFATDHAEGTYIVCTGSHIVAVQGGNYYDTWDSGLESPSYFFFFEGVETS